MSRELFKEGGELNATRIDQDQYRLTIKIPKGDDGRSARKCRADNCSPGYFKVKPGTGIIENHLVAYCPYCQHEDDPNNFYSSEQLRYAKDMIAREVQGGVSKMIRESLGLGSSGRKTFGGGLFSMEMSFTESSKPIVRRPMEEEVRRDVICPHCGLDHSVYGLATWCADCGKDIFLTHVEAEFSVVRLMLSDIDRRRESMGERIAAKDIENCLEDIVSILEAAQRALVRRHLIRLGKNDDETDRFWKKIGNGFQNLKRSEELYQNEFGISLKEHLSVNEFDELASVLEKRHPITHNLGVIDRKYLERARSNEDEGKEILVTKPEIESAIIVTMRVLAGLHSRLFQGAI